MLSPSEQESVLFEFPNIKLSYENIVYKKVYNSDIILAIPEGKKCFAWFTTFNDKNVCLIMETTSNKKIVNIKITNSCFSSELSYGTILYGTVFNYKQNKFFTIEDIFYHKGKEIEKENWGNKFILLNSILKYDLKQISYNNSFIVFGLPLFSNNYDNLLHKIKNLCYPINSIHFKIYNRVNNYFIMHYNKQIVNNTLVENNIPVENVRPIENKILNKKNTNQVIYSKNIANKEVVFKIRPDIQNDIYHLYCLNDNLQEEYYNIAHIPDYNTSVFMNNLFRNIKENKNLDALEESDDEEEFENDKEDKFVYLDKEYNIICTYNYKFKKWVPIKLADSKTKIVFKKDLPNVEKK